MRKAPLAAALVVSLGLANPASAQPMPGQGQGQGQGAMWQDPFGDATVLRQDAEAQAAARFAKLDTNNDGTLSPDELAAARPPRPDGAGRDGGDQRAGRMAGRMARMMDTNGDGKISRDEFVAGSLRRFDMMDADHDGKLTKAERQDAIEQMRARMEAMRALGGGGGGGDGPPPPGN